jgi:hypothetical protein
LRNPRYLVENANLPENEK